MDVQRNGMDQDFPHGDADRLAEARVLAERGILEDSNNGPLWQFLGMLRYRQGDYARASDAIETAGLLIPLEPAARCALAECHARAGRMVLAAEIYRQLGRDVRCPTSLLPSVASGLGGLGQHEAALAVCRKITRRNPAHHHAHFGSAFYQRKLGRPFTSIIASVSRAFELAPHVPLYRVTLAALLDHVGRREEACELLRDLNPGAIQCRCCLRRAMTIFQQSGDWRHFEMYRTKINPGADFDREQGSHF